MVDNIKLAGTFSRLGKRKILVAGDMILDTYTIGKARRISPEAPVAVVNVIREERRPGGAGNVALNLGSLGSDVVLLGRIGADASGEHLRQALEDENVDCRGLFIQQGFPTPLKNRIIAENQQVVRVDYEQVQALSETLEQRIIESLPELMQDVAVLAISDYGKGFLSHSLLRALIGNANALKIPVITDPKGVDFNKYKGTTIVKPNLSEAYAAAGLPHDANLDMAASKILEVAGSEFLMVTRSEAGISVFSKNGPRMDFPVRIREIKDVTGAGDTVLAMLAYATANGLSLQEAVPLCNLAAGIAIEKFGCARVTLSELAQRLLEEDVANKVFTQEHSYALQQALKGRECIILGLSGTDGMTSAIFHAIHNLAKKGQQDLIVYLYDEAPNAHFIELLSSINDIKFIIMQSDRLESLCDVIHPKEIYVINDNKVSKLTSYKELIKICSC